MFGWVDTNPPYAGNHNIQALIGGHIRNAMQLAGKELKSHLVALPALKDPKTGDVQRYRIYSDTPYFKGNSLLHELLSVFTKRSYVVSLKVEPVESLNHFAFTLSNDDASLRGRSCSLKAGHYMANSILDLRPAYKPLTKKDLAYLENRRTFLAIASALTGHDPATFQYKNPERSRPVSPLHPPAP